MSHFYEVFFSLDMLVFGFGLKEILVVTSSVEGEFYKHTESEKLTDAIGDVVETRHSETKTSCL